MHLHMLMLSPDLLLWLLAMVIVSHFVWSNSGWRYHMWVRSWIHNSHLMQCIRFFLVQSHDTLMKDLTHEIRSQLAKQLTPHLMMPDHRLDYLAWMLHQQQLMFQQQLNAIIDLEKMVRSLTEEVVKLQHT